MTKTWKEITASRPDTPERRAAYEQGRTKALGEIVAHNLAELRKMRSVTQVELARHLGVAQPSLSGLERRADVQLSTLRDYIEGLGGHLEVSAIFDDITVPVSLPLGPTAAVDNDAAASLHHTSSVSTDTSGGAKHAN